MPKRNESDLENRDELILEYRHYVKKVVISLIRKMQLPKENEEEYISAGYLGLVEAAERFDDSSGTDFRSFAFFRIRGSIIDSIRKSSELSGTAYRFSKALQAAHDVRENDFSGMGGTKLEPKKRLAQVLEFASKGALAYRLSFDEAHEETLEVPDEGLNPEQELLRKDSLRKVCTLFNVLDNKERLVMEGYYVHGKSFIEIAESSDGMSKSWVSRLHSRALTKLKSKIEFLGEGAS